ncbi:stage II sporulation protein R [Paenibacillus hodogayensis]|uniref:Stage II sporulation protein R n=1 Tax=Paenibacillus hodogayensis TaxID=279208 RepID=A0ABV5W7K1_9BACL
MVKRLSLRTYFLVAFALVIMMTCWESNRTQAAVLDPGIPQESIRLRILANSDAPNDQWIKRLLRDEVIRQMSLWVTEPQGIEVARGAVTDHISDLEALVGEVLAQNGYNYDYTVELGQVPFPTKIYGNKVYPAGDYEALRITLGKGEGQNWWCVLFPPLCFVDGNAGVAVAKKTTDTVKKASAEPSVQPAPAANEGQQVEVKFFLWDVIVKAVGFVKGLIA